MHSYVSFCPTPQTTPTFQKIGSSMAHIMAPVFVRGQEKIRKKNEVLYGGVPWQLSKVRDHDGHAGYRVKLWGMCIDLIS